MGGERSLNQQVRRPVGTPNPRMHENERAALRLLT